MLAGLLFYVVGAFCVGVLLVGALWVWGLVVGVWICCLYAVCLWVCGYVDYVVLVVMIAVSGVLFSGGCDVDCLPLRDLLIVLCL